MASAKSGAVKRMFAELPVALRDNVLRGAARAGAKVVADEAKSRVTSAKARGSIRIGATKVEGMRVVAKVQTKGPGAYIARWLEHGTAPHFISIDDDQRGGRSINRINRQVKEGSLVIGGQFVGKTVHHPGARPHPFLRPALDLKEADAVKAAQAYISARVATGGIFSGPEPETEE